MLPTCVSKTFLTILPIPTRFFLINQVPLMIRLRVLWILYRQVGPATLLMTLCLWMFAEFPTPDAPELFTRFLIFFFWFRTACQGLIWYIFRTFNKKGFYFYYHFGFSELQLASILYLFDLLILLFVISLYHHFL